ncbi:MAG: hypothetical protein GX560_08065 [Deinococcales bacterium]|nr:hypothetical protein [Deinococcales bacterium]
MHALARRTLTVLVAFGLALSALALTLQVGTTLELRNDAGELIGVGKVDDAGLVAFDLLEGQQGFATLTVIGPVGEEETFDALVNEAGEVVIVVDADMVPLGRLAEEAGYYLDLRVTDGAQGLGGPR